VNDRLTLYEALGMFDRILPCPPDNEPEAGSDADYLWRATLFNAGKNPPNPPWRVVKFAEVQPRTRPTYPPIVPIEESYVKIVSVVCDARGRGVRVIRP
jgi:hypothetical protein